MIKKTYLKAYRKYLGRSLSKGEFIHIIKDLLGINIGDSVLVHSSFGNLKAGFSPEEAVEILMNIVGREGNLLMPYYPSDSVNWLKNGEVFDVHSTPTRSGVLSSTFSRFPGVKKSLHPIKSLAVWGNDRDELISEHHLSKTPFDDYSPYGKLLKFSGAKTIGLGIYKNSCVHVYEDIIEEYPKSYSNNLYEGKCIDYERNSIIVKTPVHVENDAIEPCEYLNITNCPGYRTFKYKKRRFYVSNHLQAYIHVKRIVCNNGLSAVALQKDQSILSAIKSKLERI